MPSFCAQQQRKLAEQTRPKGKGEKAKKNLKVARGKRNL